MSNKRWPFLVSASVIAGTVGSLLFKRSNKRNKEKKENHSHYYVGSWIFGDNIRNTKHVLSVNPQLEFFIDELPLKGKTITLSEKEMVFRDEYGYKLTITCCNNVPVSLYDEANDEKYPIMRKNTMTD